MRNFVFLPGYVIKLVADIAPVKWPLAILAALSEYIFPHTVGRDLAMAAAALILLDTLTGLRAAAITGIAISSARFSSVLTKLLGYSSVVIVCAIATKTVPVVQGSDAVQQASVSGVITLVIMTESISVLENVQKMGIKLPFGLAELLKKRLADQEPPKP